MSLSLLRANVRHEKKLAGELSILIQRYKQINNSKGKKQLERIIDAHKNQIKILNGSIPLILDKISLIQKLPGGSKKEKPKKSKEDLISVSYNLEGREHLVAINRDDKTKYLKHLRISDVSLRNLKKKGKDIEEEFENKYKKPSYYVRTSNKLFSGLSKNWIDKGYFRELGKSLKKGGFVFLLHSYISVMFFTALLFILLGIIIAMFFFFFKIGLTSPYISLINFSQADLAIRFLMVGWIIPAVPLIVYLIMLYYPSTEAKTTEQQIDYELPFATIQMAAIAGADIEPSNIFRIVALSREYKYIGKEAKKLMNQINLYGYDLVNALRNVARASGSKAWADLLNGMSTTIKSGGDLSKFLSKRAETLMFDYRLRREKAIKSAETFMDIYVSVVIAAPMLMMLLLVIMSISGIGFEFTIPVLALIVVSIVSIINLIFLVFLHINQKKF